MKIRLILSVSLAFVLGTVSHAAFADTVGDRHTFFVNPTYDISARTSAPAVLEYVSAHAYFYVEETYVNNLSPFDRRTFDQKLAAAGQEFDSTIYVKETTLWGSEPNPGIDNDPRVTIFLERLSSGTGGYFDSTNDYPTNQAPNSNQREMIVANILSLTNDHLNPFLAHEFQHLISFNQKELLHNVSEDTWLNELRSQYSITYDGYNDNFIDSDLRSRIDTFLTTPTDSVPEWPNVNTDYASVTLFGHYLVDRFGTAILSDTLHSALTGVASINEWLAGHQQTERFGDVFADWMWANYINNRSQDPRFGYVNPNLQSIHVPPTATSMLTASALNAFTYSLKPFQPNWLQYIGDTSAGNKNLKISWHNAAFQVFYADASGAMRALQDGGIISAPTIGSNFVIMPVNETKTSNFGSTETPTSLSLVIEYTTQPIVTLAPANDIHDGSLIMHAGTPDIYVVTGPYKRLLLPDVLKFYGLNASQAVTVSEAVFQSYRVSNYVRDVNEKKVYALWPDGTKHWLNMTAQQFTDSFRDWNSVFIINDLESNFYKIGPDITR